MAPLSKRGSIQLTAGSSTELVERLRAMNPLAEGDSLSSFMGLFARRFEQISPGQPLRTDCTDAFVNDLIRYGWIKLVDKSSAKR